MCGVKDDLINLAAISFQGLSKNMNAEVSFGQINAVFTTWTTGIDLLKQCSFEHSLTVIPQPGKAFIAVIFIQNQRAKCVVEILIPEKDRIGAVFSELSQPHFIY
ncbi:hypothetical protein SDC9_189530 [bioreactor metagenome]|uniref:Uncharacterized protein n=1 Tax=bioreactor metagenome TaxID=1076179 RepID=A0A645HSF3_9ZZZZ